jgi:uncharacterized protein YndB with AHSA1/START domain
MAGSAIPPVRRTVHVAREPAAAFHRFTSEFATWWPTRTHSVGEERVQRVVFETRAGGRIFEEHLDGRRFQWGHVLEWDPPRRLRFTWHPSRSPGSAQDVELRFDPEASGTRLELVASKWENWGPHARLARNGYTLGWAYILNLYAGRTTVPMRLLDGMRKTVRVVSRVRGKRGASLARAQGEITGL